MPDSAERQRSAGREPRSASPPMTPIQRRHPRARRNRTRAGAPRGSHSKRHNPNPTQGIAPSTKLRASLAYAHSSGQPTHGSKRIRSKRGSRDTQSKGAPDPGSRMRERSGQLAVTMRSAAKAIQARGQLAGSAGSFSRSVRVRAPATRNPSPVPATTSEGQCTARATRDQLMRRGSASAPKHHRLFPAKVRIRRAATLALTEAWPEGKDSRSASAVSSPERFKPESGC